MYERTTLNDLLNEAQQQSSQSAKSANDEALMTYVEEEYWRRMADYFPAARISESTKAEHLAEWVQIFKACGPERFQIALNQVKHSVTDEDGNITPRKAYQFPMPAEIKAAVPPMYVERERVRMGAPKCDKCQDTHWVTRMFEEQTPGFGARMVPRATRCECWDAYRQSRLVNQQEGL